MPTNDVRILLQAALPTAAAGVVAVACSAAVAGGKGALGAVVATLVVVLFMGGGLVALQRTARALPQLFQAMGLMLYAAQLLLMFIFVAAFKNTSLFDPRAFALSLVGTTLVWIGTQTRAQMKARILYVDPASTQGATPQRTGSSS